MATFTCPTDNIVAGILPETRGTKRRLYSYRWATARGRNVFYLTNGSITEVAPDGTTVTWDQVETVWWGGHAASTVTTAEAAALVAAGYTVV